MASFQAVPATLGALKNYFERRISRTGLANATARVLGSQDLRGDPAGNELGIYLHRISVDPYGRNRYLPATPPRMTRQPELPVNLHLLLVGWSASSTAEASLVAWAMQEIGSALDLDVSHLGEADDRWGDEDTAQVIPEEMSTEDLMRVWDSLPGDYRLSSPYLIKTVRLEPATPVTEGPLVTTIVMPVAER